MSAARVVRLETPSALPSGRADYARRIRERLTQAVEAVLDVGSMLIEAKVALPHGEFQQMIREDLHWSPRTAQRFMAIARHPVLSNATNASLLPPSWTTLAELARVPQKRLEEAIENGLIKPDMPKAATNQIVHQYINQQKSCERQQDAERKSAERVLHVEAPPTPAEVLRGIAMDAGELFSRLEILASRVDDAIESGTFGVPRKKRQRNPGWCEADALKSLWYALNEASNAIGDTYDYLAEMTNLPKRDQEP